MIPWAKSVLASTIAYSVLSGTVLAQATGVTDFIAWGDETDSERAVLVSQGHVRVCPLPEGPYDPVEEQRACDNAHLSSQTKVPTLSCGLYAEAVAEDEQAGKDFGDVDVGNLVVYRNDCSYIAAKNIPICASNVLSGIVDSGKPLPTPTVVFSTNICAPTFNPTNLLPLIPLVPCVAGACEPNGPLTPN